MRKLNILVTNDDGFFAKGLEALIDVAKEFGNVIAVAPDTSQSGMSHALTFKNPVRLSSVVNNAGHQIYSVSGTPVDCVKMALDKICDVKPDLLFSGINHGSNASISAIYSGTVATAREGCLNGIASIAFSSLDFSSDGEFEFMKPYMRNIIQQVIENGLPEGVFLNVNFPCHDIEHFKGLRVCRQAKGVWVEEFINRKDPMERDYFWLTGYFRNFEKDARDTDEWLLSQNYASVVPLKVELTAHEMIDAMKSWRF